MLFSDPTLRKLIPWIHILVVVPLLGWAGWQLSQGRGAQLPQWLGWVLLAVAALALIAHLQRLQRGPGGLEGAIRRLL